MRCLAYQHADGSRARVVFRPDSSAHSKPRTVGSCARVTVAPAAQALAPNPNNLLKTRALPPPSESEGRGVGGRQQQQRPPPPKAPEGEKVCDSSSYTFDELVGPIKEDACGSYEVRLAWGLVRAAGMLGWRV